MKLPPTKGKNHRKLRVSNLPPLNSKRFVIPILLGAQNIDICINTGFRHDWVVRAQQSDRCDLITVNNTNSRAEEASVERRWKGRGV